MSESGADAPRPVGRPTDFKPEFIEIAANLCAGGATDFEVAQAIDCGVSTLYSWKARYPEFREAMKVGKELADDRVEASLYHRAVGYSHPAVKILQNSGSPVIVPYTEHVPPEPSCLKLWLTNRKRGDWAERVTQEHTGAMEIMHKRGADDLTDDELAAIAAGSRPAPAQSKEG